MGWDQRTAVPFPSQTPNLIIIRTLREGSRVKRWELQNVCKRQAERSIWKEVLWAQCPLVKLFICLWRWPYNVVNVVTLTSSNAAQWASCKLVQEFSVPSSWEKVKKGERKKDKAYIPWGVPLPRCRQLSKVPFHFNKQVFVVVVLRPFWSLGWWASPQSIGKITWRKNIMDACLQTVACGNSTIISSL